MLVGNKMKLSSETKQIQYAFHAYCTTGIEQNLPGINQQRIKEYRRLVFANIQDQLESAFPLTYSYLPNNKWEQLVHDFFEKHACTTPQIWKLGGEFCNFCKEQEYAEKWVLPFLNDLLRFEWEEIVLYSMEDLPYPKFQREGNLLTSPIAINPEHKILHLEYPIHHEKIEEAIHKKGNYFVLMYREQESGKIQFLDISIWFAIMLEQLYTQQKTVEELLLEAPAIFGEIDCIALRKNTLIFLEDLRDRKFIIGFKK